MNNDILIKYKEHLIARSNSLNYYLKMRIFLSYLDSKQTDYQSITQDTITQFFNDKDYNAQSKNGFINAGRSYYAYTGNHESEWHKIKLMKTERKIPNYMSDKDLGKAISYLITYNHRIISSIKAEALLNFLFYSGVRKAELLDVKRADFTLDENTAKVFGKGHKERMIYFPEKVKEKVIAYFESEEEKNNAFNITLYDINYLIRTLKKYFPDKNITAHLFRHSGAREMLRKGIPLAVVSKILGHSSVQTTMIYADENEEGRKNIYKDKMK